jgi:hypothetical protein
LVAKPTSRTYFTTNLSGPFGVRVGDHLEKKRITQKERIGSKKIVENLEILSIPSVFRCNDTPLKPFISKPKVVSKGSFTVNLVLPLLLLLLLRFARKRRGSNCGGCRRGV